MDVFEGLKIFKLFNNDIISFENSNIMKRYIENYLRLNCPDLVYIIYSDNVENIYGLC